MLASLDGLDPDVWARTDVIGERGLGAILVHHLGASVRWRIGLQSQGVEDGPELELEPLMAIDELRDRWVAEWLLVDVWLPRLTDGEVQYVSPNANSALHRVGIQASAVGMRLAELGFHDGPVRQCS